MKNPLAINPKQEADRIISFLKKTLKEQKISKVVIGLSGGIDSTVVLYLLKKVLPLKNIYVVRMDYYPLKKITIDLKGVRVINVPINKIVDLLIKESEDTFFEKIARGPRGGVAVEKNGIELSLSRIRIGNIMARVRMIILFDLAKQLRALVCGTENKSEKLLGYFTRFGDAASDIEPISHLYKTQIYQLAKYLKIPEKIIDQPPSAGLWNDQTDEKDFGFTYAEADQVLYLINQGQSLKGLTLEYKNAEKIIKRVKQNKFKQLTPYFLV